MAGRDQRTEKPTPQKLRKAREEGRFPVSREFVAGVQFCCFAAIVVWTAGSWWPRAGLLMRRSLLEAFRPGEPWAAIQQALGWLTPSLLLPLGLTGLAIFAAGLIGQLSATGFGLALTKVGPDLTRLNPTQRLKGLLPQNLRSLREALVLLLCVSVIGLYSSQALLAEHLSVTRMTLRGGVAFLGDQIGSLLLHAAGFLLIWGVIDLAQARRRYTNELKMTKQEIREEHRQNDGSPEVKMRIRRLRRELLRRRMMSQVEEATAVVTNPTHYAVALKYDFGSSGAPRVVAKGKNFLALRIRQRAAEHQVPVIENPPLARALYAAADVGSEIPAHLYRAVAEVLAYVFRVLGRMPGKEGR
jgi:flagellar biosynthetic protein FlhB